MDDDAIRYGWRQKAILASRSVSFYIGVVLRLVAAGPFIIAIGIAAILSWLSDQVFGST